MLHVAMAWSSDNNTVCKVFSSFMDVVMLSHSILTGGDVCYPQVAYCIWPSLISVY